MIKMIRKWAGRKLTLIVAPGRASRSLHIQFSYPFALFLMLFLVSILVTGIYFTDVYLNYRNAVSANRELVQKNDEYAQKVEEVLDVLQDIRANEIKVRGMLGMESSQDILENYPIGSSENSLAFDNFNSGRFERERFMANINMIREETWNQNNNVKEIENYIDRKRDILLSTPSIWPTFGYITSPYGWRDHPITKRRELHRGMDIYNPLKEDAPIRATAPGKVVSSGWAGSYGKLVIIDHGNNFSTRYAHCSEILVEQGDEVTQGQIIAYMGRTGRATGPPLHYEVWHKGQPVNPIEFVKGR